MGTFSLFFTWNVSFFSHYIFCFSKNLLFLVELAKCNNSGCVRLKLFSCLQSESLTDLNDHDVGRVVTILKKAI